MIFNQGMQSCSLQSNPSFFCQYWVMRFPVGENFIRKDVSFSTIQSVLMKFSSLITREARSKVFSPLY